MSYVGETATRALAVLIEHKGPYQQRILDAAAEFRKRTRGADDLPESVTKALDWLDAAYQNRYRDEEAVEEVGRALNTLINEALSAR